MSQYPLLFVNSILMKSGAFRTQTDQRSDDSNLQHVKGGKVETIIKQYHMYFTYLIYFIGNFQPFSQHSQ